VTSADAIAGALYASQMRCNENLALIGVMLDIIAMQLPPINVAVNRASAWSVS